MKLFELSIKDLKEFIIQKKMIFIILFFSIIVSSYGFFFFSSLNMNSAQLMNTYTGESSCFFVSGEDITYQKINELLKKIQNIKSDISYRVYSNVEYGKKIKNIKSGEEKQLYNLIIGTNKIIIDSNDFIGREITEEDRKNCTNYIMIDSLSEIATSDMLIYNKTININGKEYKVMAIDLLNIRINKYINYISDNKKIDNINDIERFKNYDILVDREDAVPLMDGEFFICDVLDADVYDQNDEHIGILDDVLETPANDVFVVKKDDGGELLIPVVSDFVYDVDTENRKVKVRTFEMVEADDSDHKTE